MLVSLIFGKFLFQKDRRLFIAIILLEKVPDNLFIFGVASLM